MTKNNNIMLLFSHLNSWRPYGLRHTRLPCLSPSPGVCPSSCPLNRWCHPTISSSVALFFYLQFFQASGPFPMSCLHQVTQILELHPQAVPPMNIQGWFSLQLTDLISLQSQGLSRVFSITTIQKHQFFGTQPTLWANSHIHTWLLERP